MNCSVDWCDLASKKRGWCNRHYQRWQKYSDPLAGGSYIGQAPILCTVEGCGKEARSIKSGLCNMHARPKYVRQCKFPGCRRKGPHGLCIGHQTQRDQGKELTPLRSYIAGCDGSDPCRAEHSYMVSGYRMLTHQRGAPNADKYGKVLEHTVVMAGMIGRPLLPGENVHHKNGVRNDNRPKNLELWVTSQPSGQRPEDLLEWADEIIARYRNN